MDVEVQNVDDSLRIDRIVTIRSNGVSTRLNERRLEVTRHTKPRHDTRHTMEYSFYKPVQTNDTF